MNKVEFQTRRSVEQVEGGVGLNTVNGLAAAKAHDTANSMLRKKI